MQNLINRLQITRFGIPEAETALRRYWPELRRHLPFWISVLLVLALARTLALLTWELLPQPSSTPVSISMDTPAAPANKTFDITDLVNMHLFGTVPVAASTNAPDTTLNLTLHGILASNKHHQDSRAIIAASDNDQTYAIGDHLSDGAVIQDIDPDQVILSIDGRTESLRLPKANLPADGNNSIAPGMPMMPMGLPALGKLRPQPDYGSAVPGPSSVGKLRNELVSHPEKLMDMVRAMPVMTNNKLAGYRVFPAGNTAVFSQLGLKPGDVITAVNGMPLDNPASSMRILDNLKTSSQIAITLTRNGQQQTQVVQLQGPGN